MSLFTCMLLHFPFKNLQTAKEGADRLNAATTTILSLEAKIRDLSQTDNSVSKVLQGIRDAAQEELRTYQQDSEEMFNRSLAEVKVGDDTH